MRPRNVLTETNDMRKLMGLPLINEDGGQTIDDVKKKVLNENHPSFSLGFANAGGLTIAEEEEDIDETTEAEKFNDEGDDDLDVVEEGDDLDDDNEEEEEFVPMNEIEKAQKMAEERELKSKELNIKSNKNPMEDNLTEDTGFAKYNITLDD